MNTSTPGIAAILSLGCIIVTSGNATSIYSENFSNSGSSNVGLNTVGWNFAYNASGFLQQGDPSISESEQAPIVSSLAGEDTGNGYIYIPSGAVHTFHEELLVYASNLTEYAYSTIDTVSFSIRNTDPTDKFSLALKVDGNWYVSTASYGTTSNTWNSFSVNPQTDTDWDQLEFNITSQQMIRGASSSLPSGGALQSVGLYLESVPSADTVRLDSVSIEAQAAVISYNSWGGIEPDPGGHINTGTWLGWIHVGYSPWLWSYSLNRWIYAPDPGPGFSGAWLFITQQPSVQISVAAPEFSPQGGTFSSAQVVTMTSSTEGATLRYTTDGSTPTSTNGRLYSGSLSISTTTSLKAIGFRDGMADSSVTSATYTIESTNGPKPNAANTGPSNPALITTSSAGRTVSSANAILENTRFTGTIHVRANNVTIRNCIIDGGLYGINCNYGASGLLIEDCEIKNATSAGIFGGNFTARRLNIHDIGGDGLKPTTQCLLEDSFIHHLGKNDGAHADGVQSRHGGSNMTFRGNNFDMPITDPAPYKSNAAFMLEPDGGQLTHVLIEENWMNGGNFTVYGSGMSGVTVRHNRIGRDYRYGIRNSVVNWYGNVWDDTGQSAQ